MDLPTGVLRFLIQSVFVLTCSFPVLAQVETQVQGNLVDFEEQGIPSVLHIRQFDAPSVGLGFWTEEALVQTDGSFSANLGVLSGPTMIEFSAPPWSWMAMVRPGESSMLRLAPSSQEITRLMKVPGIVHWTDEHPSSYLDALAQIQKVHLKNLVEPMTVKSTGMRGLTSDSLDRVVFALDSSFQEKWSHCANKMHDPVFVDLCWQSQWSWQMAMGSSETVFDSLWIQWQDSRPNQALEEKLQSPGWMGAWFVRYDQWWKHRRVDPERLKKAVYSADMDTLRLAMGPKWKDASIEDLAIVWLMKAIESPDKLTLRIWETMAFPEPFRRQHKRMLDARNPSAMLEEREEMRWSLPNGNLQSYSDVCEGSWKIMLVVRNGSGAALRERELYSKIMQNKIFTEICFLVLSVDSSVSDWRESLSKRSIIEEQLVWLGNNPENYEALGISSIPQIIAIGPKGQISRNIHSLPSQGLGAELERMLPSFRSNY